MPVTPSCLLGNFEESLLNGRMNPVGLVYGFYADIGVEDYFPSMKHCLFNASFYHVAASPYLGIINLSSLGKRGYRGTIQVLILK